ncbi:MAG TPA: GNAT family N-acetyltransferase [Blastocatellia bacterium]|nr:GNAT family N-acetyltransferase [Blastocatellia bacterium]
MSTVESIRHENPPNIQLRKAEAGDAEFFYGLYRDTRRDEVAAWGWSPEQEEIFFRMQFRGLQHAYQSQADIADDQVITADQAPIGRLIVLRTPKEIRLADISLAPQWRGRGIGGTLIEKLFAESNETGKAVTLHVQKDNPAARLYTRLGFVVTEDTGAVLTMERRP